MSTSKVVMVSEEEVRAFASRWPASGMRDKGAVAFTFESNGDIVDVEPYGWDEGVDGAAAVALSQDAQRGILGTVVGGSEGTPLSTRAVHGNSRRIERAAIRILSAEAAEAGDLAMVAICQRALDGDDRAIRECERVIAEARAAAHGNPRRVALTPENIQRATMDAGNRSMRKAGRTAWSEEDRDAASAEADRLWNLYDSGGATQGNPSRPSVLAVWKDKLGRAVMLLRASPGYIISAPGFGVYITASTDEAAIAKAQKLVDRGFNGRLVRPLKRSPLYEGDAERMRGNPGDVHVDIHSHNAAGNPVQVKSPLGSWILALSFFERHRRGAEAKLGHNTVLRQRLGKDGAKDMQVIYHETPLVTYHEDGTITLNSGGWATKTTKDRLGIFLPVPLHVVQTKGKWYVRNQETQEEIPFFDGMRFGIRPTYEEGREVGPSGIARRARS
ncbi:MAG: hypothetical protein WC729_29960 [Sphingomonas sp.]|jgi:hypothetical protein|uniref:hypothetical protein n=1 Tax=Sphingomonas sp. TaxID=28214 RepID=UPI00356A1009